MSLLETEGTNRVEYPSLQYTTMVLYNNNRTVVRPNEEKGSENARRECLQLNTTHMVFDTKGMFE